MKSTGVLSLASNKCLCRSNTRRIKPELREEVCWHLMNNFLTLDGLLERRKPIASGTASPIGARPIANLTRSWMQPITKFLCHHLGQLRDSTSFKFSVGLATPTQPSNKVKKLIRDRLELDDDDIVLYSRESRFNAFASCMDGDVVLYKEDDMTLKAGKVQLHVDVNGIPITMIEEFDAIRREVELCSSTWRSRGETSYVFIETSNIRETVIYSKLPDDMYNILMPIEYR